MPVEIENSDQSTELTFYRDTTPGFVFVEATTFGDAGAWSEPLGSFKIRDLVIALHALSA